MIGNDSFSSRLPSSGANDTVLISMLESLYNSDGFVDVSANLFVVNSDGSDFSLSVNHKKSTESSSIESILWVFHQHAILSGDIFSDICQKRDVDLS